jgi:hypothetical protein
MTKAILIRPCAANVEIELGKTDPHLPAAATEFEKRVGELQLTRETCTDSSELRKWCERNRNRSYIPESLLEAWGITVDSVFGPLER